MQGRPTSYEGRTDFEPDRIFGHENVGEVIEVGAAVDKVRVGDMVSAPVRVREASRTSAAGAR